MIRTLPLAALLLGTAPVHAAPTEWTLDLGHAHIGWEINHMGLSRTVGRFNSYDGTFLIDEADPANSQITFTIDAASIDSNHGPRDAHLRHADYLDAENHGQITFTSTDVLMLTPTSGKLTGDLTMRGQTAPVTLDFTMIRDRTYPDFIPNYDEVRVVGFEATGEILRLDHGMDFITFLDSPTGLSVDVDLHFDLVQCAGTPNTNIPCTWGR
ncbi:YceI family protein [uncultured Tateyamaria sp.]|uniref:YceI family protein n=1 Tax=uncultured Tateyamaria sp. TaxID=455651 RepID=UPI00262E920C|nr:YceI family protein [uncultured Tateyamaria sp.]